MRDLLLRKRAKRGPEHRHYYAESTLVAGSRRAAEVVLTTLFWGLWAYLVAPMLSLLLWFGGVYLFVDRMITLGGYEAFARELATYSVVVAVICVLLLWWVLWNQRRYGGVRNRRTVHPRHLSDAEMARAMHLSPKCVAALHDSATIALRFDEHGHPLIERASASGARIRCAIGRKKSVAANA
jgi:poly-beta-1,6-N-acetyl-D-glucosamine biosynthesis protein PgaD